MPQVGGRNTFTADKAEDSVLFWLFAGILTVLAALALAAPFWKPRAVPASRAEHDVEAFRAQLREVEHDLSRGVLTEAEAESARIELSRRLLAAAEAAEIEVGAKSTPSRLTPVLGFLAAIGVPAIGMGVYSQLGSPSLGDRPYAQRNLQLERADTRPSQEQAEAQFATQRREPPTPSPARTQMLDLADKVRERLKSTPEDPQGWNVLARSLKTLEIYDESWRAFDKVATLNPEAADADLYANMAEAMFMAAGGYMSPEAEVITDKALANDPGFHQALFFKGLALAQRGDLEPAMDGWVKMLKTAPPNAPWIAQVQDNVRNAAAELGLEPPADLVPRGPTSAQQAAAAEMSPEAQMEMIAGMVDGLSERLDEEPNDLRGWLMLIRSYRILDREEDAKAAQTRGLEAFSDDAEATKQLEAAL